MATDIASGVIETFEDLPYVGPVCSIIQNILQLVNDSEEVREACTEEIPTELEMMQITLRLLPESIGQLVGDAKVLCDTRLSQLGRHLEEMKSIVIDVGSKGTIKKIITAKADKGRIAALLDALERSKSDLTLLLNICAGFKLNELSTFNSGLRGDIIAWLEKLSVSDAKLLQSTNLLKELEAEYNEYVQPQMEKLEEFRERMGSRYATAMVVPPYLVTPEERGEVFKTMKNVGGYWKNVQRHCEEGRDILSMKNSWLQRAIHYRLLAEPLDIANWYCRRKNLDSGHYIDGIPDDNDLTDNHKRPGRYILFQRKEGEVGRTPVSSLETARQLKKILQGISWDKYVPENRPQIA